MLPIETVPNADNSFKILLLLLAFVLIVFFGVMFREPIGTLLVRLESLQLPFVSARFTKARQDEGLDGDKESDRSKPPTAATRGE